MKKILLLLALSFSIIQNAVAQETAPQLQKRIADSICNALEKADLDKVTTKDEATSLFTESFSKNTNMLLQLAELKHIDPTDQAAMRGLGIEIGKDLVKMNCAGFMKISVVMAKSKINADEGSGVSAGTFKRIDLKGFNYIVIKDDKGLEKSFLWMGNFSGSEKFMKGSVELLNKKLRITWQQTEAYLPEAKGYYNIKVITAIAIL